MIYCFDTSAFIAAWIESYPKDVMPKLWNDFMPSLVEAGRLVTPKDVLLELEKKAGKDDGLCDWIKVQGEAVVELDEPLLLEGKRIINKYRRLIELKRGRSGADPFVIALASLRGATVVTKEGMSGSLEKPSLRDHTAAVKVRLVSAEGGRLPRELAWLSSEAPHRGLVGQINFAA